MQLNDPKVYLGNFISISWPNGIWTNFFATSLVLVDIKIFIKDKINQALYLVYAICFQWSIQYVISKSFF